MRTTKLILFFILSAFSAAAAAEDGFFLTPAIGVGFNSTQGTAYSLGIDAGYQWNEYFFGLGAYDSYGNHPEDDRELGIGPFFGAVYELAPILTATLREDIDHVDQRDPVVLTNGDYSYISRTGVISATYAGIHLWFTRNLGISLGYRLVLGLTDSALGTGRSGVAAGLTIGF